MRSRSPCHRATPRIALAAANTRAPLRAALPERRGRPSLSDTCGETSESLRKQAAVKRRVRGRRQQGEEEARHDSADLSPPAAAVVSRARTAVERWFHPTAIRSRSTAQRSVTFFSDRSAPAVKRAKYT